MYTKKHPFRMQKLNIIWEKAKTKLDGKALKNLHEDMKHQDANEIALKKLKADHHDKDGLREAQVRKEFRALMRKYSIEWEDKNIAGKDINNKPADSNAGAEVHEKPLFKDKKVDKLWKKAKKGDLNEEQLKILKEELKHYEEKMSQYHHMISELHSKKHKEKARQESLENHIDEVLGQEEIEKELKVEETSKTVEAKHRELKDEYRRLSDAVFNATVNGQKLKGGEFEEERASKLWSLALKSDFTDEELETLRDELLHFQTRIQKLNFFRAQLESDKMAGKKGLNEVTEEGEKEGLSDHAQHIVRKVKELNHKVEKMHSKIETQILQRHSEL